jgi:hypothetical protein
VTEYEHLLGNALVNILKVTQSTIGPQLLSSQCFSKHPFVTRNSLHGHLQATKNFYGYELAYISSHAGKKGGFVTQTLFKAVQCVGSDLPFVTCHSGRDARSPVRNGVSHRELLTVSCHNLL